MTPADRELLMLAARAAGYDVYWDEESESYLHRKPTVRECGGWRLTWDPRENDGDSFRLAVRLRLQLVTSGVNVVQAIHYESGAYGGAPVGEDRDAAVRLAVLRAGAEIAKAQQGSRRVSQKDALTADAIYRLNRLVRFNSSEWAHTVDITAIRRLLSHVEAQDAEIAKLRAQMNELTAIGDRVSGERERLRKALLGMVAILEPAAVDFNANEQKAMDAAIDALAQPAEERE